MKLGNFACPFLFACAHVPKVMGKSLTLIGLVKVGFVASQDCPLGNVDIVIGKPNHIIFLIHSSQVINNGSGNGGKVSFPILGLGLIESPLVGSYSWVTPADFRWLASIFSRKNG